MFVTREIIDANLLGSSFRTRRAAPEALTPVAQPATQAPLGVTMSFRALVVFALPLVLMVGCRQATKREQHEPPSPQSRTIAPTRVAPPVPAPVSVPGPVPGPVTKPPRRTPNPPEPEVLRFAVLPLEPLWETTDSLRSFAQRKLEKHLRDHPKVELIAAAQVAQAMKELGVLSPSKCDQRCLIRLGRRLGAHRVLGGTVRMQKKVQSKGTVWEFSADLVHVQRGATWGHYQTVCICWRGQQDKLLGRQVSRMLAYHPDRWNLKMTRPTPVPPPANAPRTPGMVYVPAGEFIMGSEYGEPDESPRHVVHTTAFFIDQYEVTNAAYDRCVKAQKCVRSTTRADLKYSAPRQPVAGVGFKDARAYCRFAGKRLLTEAEWEKAAPGSASDTWASGAAKTRSRCPVGSSYWSRHCSVRISSRRFRAARMRSSKPANSSTESSPANSSCSATSLSESVAWVRASRNSLKLISRRRRSAGSRERKVASRSRSTGRLGEAPTRACRK